MQKIMFEQKRFGLEQAVISGIKKMTRRLAKLPAGVNPDDVTNVVMGIDEKGRVYFTLTAQGTTFYLYPKYQIGEEVAVAQSYKDAGVSVDNIVGSIHEGQNMYTLISARETKGWNNKMFVRADLMPYSICIKEIKFERLQDISEEDCRREGIIPVQWKQWLKQDINDFSPQKYKLWNLWTLPKFKESIIDSWAESDPDEFMAESPQVAFTALIYKMMSEKVWNDNPWVFAYTFELCDHPSP